MADVGDRRGFHFHGGDARESGADARQRLGAVDEGVTAADQAAHRVQIQLFDAAFRQRDQRVVGDERRRAAGHLARLVAEGGDVGVVVAHFFRHHDIAHAQRAGQAAGGTGVDHQIRAAVFQ